MARPRRRRRRSPSPVSRSKKWSRRRVDRELGLLPLARLGAALDAGDEGAAVMARLLLGGLERLAADDLPQLVRLHRRRLDREVQEDLVAHVLLDVDRDLEALPGGRLRAAGIGEVLRPDSECDPPAGVAAEPGPPLPRRAITARWRPLNATARAPPGRGRGRPPRRRCRPSRPRLVPTGHDEDAILVAGVDRQGDSSCPGTPRVLERDEQQVAQTRIDSPFHELVSKLYL